MTLNNSNSSNSGKKTVKLRYSPPGIIVEYSNRSSSKLIDLLDFTEFSDIERVADGIVKDEMSQGGMESKSKSFKRAVVTMLQRLQQKLKANNNQSVRYECIRRMECHAMPLTNCIFNKAGDKFLTGSYDRTCRVWDTTTGKKLLTLAGHNNVVYSLAFNTPFCDMIATGSFDKTVKIWSPLTGQCHTTFANGHTAEIVALSFSPTSMNPTALLATGGLDNLCCVWDVRGGVSVARLKGHAGEVTSVEFAGGGAGVGRAAGSESESEGGIAGVGGTGLLLTAGFDATVNVWESRMWRPLHTLIGHRREITGAQFNYASSVVLTGSMDGSAKLWDVVTGSCLTTLSGHTDDILSTAYSPSGHRIATASADSTIRIYDSASYEVLCVLRGHTDEVLKVSFNSRGDRVLTSSRDGTARIWDVCGRDAGVNLQVLKGHTDDVFTCAFNYMDDLVLTGSKDNTCAIWKQGDAEPSQDSNDI